MSGLAGALWFDPRRIVAASQMEDILNALKPIGPDGGGTVVLGRLGMAFSGLATTPEAHREAQPLQRAGAVLTWDGRLDNRSQLLAAVEGGYASGETDAEIVLSSYLKYGASCIGLFRGDFALAIWDKAKETLILARDCFGVRPLYYKLSDAGIHWCSLLEPLLYLSVQLLAVDEEYLADYICSSPSPSSTPFRDIRAVMPGHFLEITRGGTVAGRRYWSLNPHGRIHYKTDAEYEEHFRHVFRLAVHRRVRAERTVLCELSGGLDSSSIVCMADQLNVSEGTPKVRTISYFDPDEPSGDERPYIEIVERLRNVTGDHISLADFNTRSDADPFELFSDESSWGRPGLSKQRKCWDQELDTIHRRVDARVLLSGIGGDELLGGVQYEALGLLEHLSSGRLVTFWSSILAWSIARRKTIPMLLADMWKLACAPLNIEAFVLNVKPPEWLVCEAGPRDQMLKDFAIWPRCSPGNLCSESARYALASMLSASFNSLTGSREKRYPYLDLDLFEFLASIPRDQVIRPRERRSLMRRALREIVPSEILGRKTKWFGSRAVIRLFVDHSGAIDRILSDPWMSDARLIDLKILRNRIGETLSGMTADGLQLRNAIAVEVWLRDLGRRRIGLDPAWNI
jgi:asparagine synthase (glutamine-hydrolysing)